MGDHGEVECVDGVFVMHVAAYQLHFYKGYLRCFLLSFFVPLCLPVSTLLYANVVASKSYLSGHRTCRSLNFTLAHSRARGVPCTGEGEWELKGLLPSEKVSLVL
jgi:hypothetical protein